MILLHDESDNVDEQAKMSRMEMVMRSVMMIICVGDGDRDELYADYSRV